MLKFVSVAPVPAARGASIGLNGSANGGSSLSAPNGGNGSRGPSSPTPSSTPSSSNGADLPVGQKLGFQILVDSVSGISKEDFASVHLQVKLSSFAGNALGKDEIYTSVPVDLTNDDSISELRLRRTLSFVLNTESIERLRIGAAPIELYAKLKPRYLVALEQHDAERESGEDQTATFAPLHSSTAMAWMGSDIKKKSRYYDVEHDERASF